MDKSNTDGLSRKQRQRLEDERTSRAALTKANVIVSLIFILTWAAVLLLI